MTRETKQRQKKNDDDIILANCDAIVIFPIYGQFGAIQKPDSEHCFHNTALNKGTIIAKKANFLQTKCWHQQNQEHLGTKRYIFWN